MTEPNWFHDADIRESWPVRSWWVWVLIGLWVWL